MQQFNNRHYLTMNTQSNYINHPLNNSPTKYTYTFSKNNRTQKTKRLYTQTFYQIPDMKSNRTCTFGYGNKMQYRNQSKSPSPNRYTIKSQFQPNQNHKKGFNFGSGRNDTTFQHFLKSATLTKDIPAPNQYVLPSTFKQVNITFKKRLPTEIDIKQKNNTPGPGSYFPLGTQISPRGKYPLSNFRNVSTANLHTNRRTHENRTPQRIIYKQQNKTLSKEKKSQKKIEKIQKSEYPGPGQYNVFSQFGIPKRQRKLYKYL